ncbi:MAG TPA: type II toxin-antitoxin system mRNA interferase toxin, RelE/StbE family, partial [Chromatiales bacterium]|nr:type II toxin-antitoxin system mRNA interferase toxin, RelE/StbE family [Chromatiales bacterium]
MWQILEHRRVARRLPRTPVEILKRYEKWKDIVA